MDFNYDYIEAMRLWARRYRPDGKLPAEALNIHHYCERMGLDPLLR
jgi:hypothetical protein